MKEMPIEYLNERVMHQERRRKGRPICLDSPQRWKDNIMKKCSVEEQVKASVAERLEASLKEKPTHRNILQSCLIYTIGTSGICLNSPNTHENTSCSAAHPNLWHGST